MPPAQSVTLWHLLQYLSKKAHFRAATSSKEESEAVAGGPAGEGDVLTAAEDDAPTATVDAQSTAVAAQTNERAQNTPRAGFAVFDVTALFRRSDRRCASLGAL
jgi:hypothetical protein